MAVVPFSRRQSCRKSFGENTSAALAQRRRWMTSAPKSGGRGAITQAFRVVVEAPATRTEVNRRLRVLDDRPVLDVPADDEAVLVVLFLQLIERLLSDDGVGPDRTSALYRVSPWWTMC